MLRNITKSLRSVVERSIAKSYETKKNASSNGVSHEDTMVPLPKSLNMELEEAARELKKKQISELDKLKGHLDFQQYAIKGDDDQWNEALKIKDSTNEPITPETVLLGLILVIFIPPISFPKR